MDLMKKERIRMIKELKLGLIGIREEGLSGLKKEMTEIEHRIKLSQD
jgi:hypothetical protein